MKKSILTVALVGLGHIGKVHLDSINSVEELQIRALVDNRIPISEIPCFKTIKECHEAYPDIDLYVIATPNGLHYEQAKEALTFKKNVLVEKPIVLHKTQLEELLSLATQNEVRIFSSMQLRYSPVISYVKNLIEKNRLGQLFLISAECFWNRNDEYYKKSPWHGTKNTDGGVLFTQFSHFIDILNYLLNNNLDLVHSQTENFSHKNSIEFPDSGILQFKSGNTLGTMMYTISTYKKNFESSITIIAEKGTLKIGGQYMDNLLYHTVDNVEPQQIKCEHHNFHKNLYEDIIISLKENQPSLSDAQNALNMIDFIEKVVN